LQFKCIKYKVCVLGYSDFDLSGENGEWFGRNGHIYKRLFSFFEPFWASLALVPKMNQKNSSQNSDWEVKMLNFKLSSNALTLLTQV
jgi:hypothetical protein